MAAPVHFERRMSDTEALMWNLEKDPALRSAFANVTFLDRPVDHRRFRARMIEAADAVPRLAQRVVQPPARLAPPLWQDDPTFDIDFHVRRVAVPPPGGEREVLDLAAALAADPFDRARPLWQFVIIEGLADGRGALFQKMHHTITDGEGGVRLSLQFLDFERDPDEPASESTGDQPAGAASAAGRRLTPLGVAAGTLTHSAARTARLAGWATRGALGLVRNPTRAPAAAGEVAETVRSTLRQLAVTEPARSPIWTHRGLARRIEVLRVPLDDAKRAAKDLGGTVNDFFVTGAAAAAGAYHRAKGADVDELRLAMPVSTRTDRGAGGNAFSPTRVLVPVQATHPVEHFHAVRERLMATKAERAVGIASELAGFLTLLPTSLLVQFARQQAGTVDFAASNVRGAPVDLFIAGARIEANYPMGPTAGTAFNLTTLSYSGSLDMGCAIDTAAIDDPALLRACLEEAYQDLLAAV